MGSGKTVLSADEQAHLRRRVDELGVNRVAGSVGIHSESVTRAVGGLAVRAGTIALIERYLASGGGA